MGRIGQCVACGQEAELPEEPLAGGWGCPHCGAANPATGDIDDAPPLSFDTRSPDGNESTVRRPVHAGPSMGKQLVGIFGGGFLGLAIGYYILVLIRPEANFLGLNLPGFAERAAPATDDQPRQPGPAAQDRPPAEQPDSPQRPPGVGDRPEPEAPAPAHPDAPAPDPLAPGNFVGPRNYRPFTGADLRQALDELAAEPAATLDPSLYRRLSHLAEIITSVEMAPLGWDARERREVVEKQLRRIVPDRAAANELGRLSAFWLTSIKRDDPGILAAGTLESVATAGRVAASRLMLLSNPRELIVLSRAKPVWQPPARLLVVGTIVEDPARNIAGYEGTAAQIVWGAMFVKLDDGG